MQKLLFVVLIMISFSYGTTATQTDWSGGGGVSGPVTDWGDCYDVPFQIDSSGSSVQLESGVLLNNPVYAVHFSFAGASSIYAADVDGDGDTDVLGTADEDDDITWYENTDGTGASWIVHTLDGDFDGASSVCAMDFDGDGDTDVLGGSSASDGVYLWENTDGTGTTWTLDRVDDLCPIHSVSTVIAADINDNGDTDVVVANSTGFGCYWYELTTGGVWAYYPVSNSDRTVSMCVADVDGDGDLDLLGARSFLSAYQDEISWWENTDGTGMSWTKRTVSANFEGAASVYAADMDGDGDIDVLGAAEDHDETTWWENSDGTGTSWVEHIIDGDFDQAHSVCATDVDGDGDMDVLGSSFVVAGGTLGYILMWENIDGAGTQWAGHIVANFVAEGNSLFTADVNGNGHTDLLGARRGFGGSLAWYELIGYPLYGTLESSILDAGAVDSWEMVAYDSDEPTETSVGFQFRSSDDSANMGTWSDTVFASGTSLSGILADSTDFLQYKVILQSSDVSSTPVLNDITFTYSINVSIDENASDVVTGWDLTPAANPSYGNSAVQVSVPQSGMVNLVLHDVTGRVIAQYSQELPGGTHSVSFNNLAQGVYFCTMNAGDFTATEQIVVLK